MQDQQIYIIGAGVSGLIAAYELEHAGYHPIVIERSSDVGGRLKTIHEKGYALDLGFQVLLSAYPLAKHYLNMDKLELRKLESGALVYAEGKTFLIGDPLRNWKMLIPTLLSSIGSIGDKLKILKLNRRLAGKSLEAIFESPEMTTLKYLQQFVLSPKIINRFFKPFFAGIFLEPELSTSSRMFEFVYKMFGEGDATIPKLGIGAISHQLKGKLKNTTFRFNTEVKDVTNNYILLGSGEQIKHTGVILAANASSVMSKLEDQDTAWKSCMCLYFEVDTTNIPDHTIALIADAGNYANNLYAYTDNKTGKIILSVTSLQFKGKANEDVIEKISEEIRNYVGANSINYIHHYTINQALPDISNLRMTAQPSESQVIENVYLAGDYLFNGSLNAAMESGRLAALGLVEKKRSVL